jgi:hypothetical protein
VGRFAKRRPSAKAFRTGSGRIAQLVEQLTLNQRVPGSSPGAPTIAINDLADLVALKFGAVYSTVYSFVLYLRYYANHRSARLGNCFSGGRDKLRQRPALMGGCARRA